MQRRPLYHHYRQPRAILLPGMVEILHPIPAIPIPITIVVAIVITTLMYAYSNYQLKD